MVLTCLLYTSLGDGQTAHAVITPTRQFNAGKGNGHRVETTVNGGVVGLILDGRGRPFEPSADKDRTSKLLDWLEALDVRCV